MKKICKWFAWAIAAALLLSAGALAEIDLQRDVRLTVEMHEDGQGLSGFRFDLYRVADMDGAGAFTPAAPFDVYNVKLDGLSESAMAGVATTLEGYVLRDHVAPMQSGVTESSGAVAFSDSGMKAGLYLVLAPRHVADGMEYVIQPTVVQLPMWDEAGQRWSYDVIVNAKYESAPDSPDAEVITRKVLKVWAETGNGQPTPAEVVIHLLRDGEVFDTVTLNAETLWRHTWEALDAGHHWTVVEEPLENYSVVVTREGITFVVTNTSEYEEPEPTPTPPPPDDPKLPQTGQLWWPVAMLMCAGLFLIVLGLLRRRSE